MNSLVLISLFNVLFCFGVGADISDLPEEHIMCFFNSHKEFYNSCKHDTNCKFKHYLDKSATCWGYEPNCSTTDSVYRRPVCQPLAGESEAKRRQRHEDFFNQADFGYVRQRAATMFPLCLPDNTTDEQEQLVRAASSSINCTANLEFCRGRQVALDLRELAQRTELLRYRMDVLKPGQISVDCSVDERRLAGELQFMSPLQSWAPELQHLRRSDSPRLQQQQRCDVTIDTPTYIMKLDAVVSMYHHFCDFFNLYASQHLNESDNAGPPHSFDRNKQIIVWENTGYRSAFAPMFKLFTTRPILDLSQLAGKRVCLRDVVFPLLPRMIFGLFYNTPLVDGCSGSGLFSAFSEHALARLSVSRHQRRHRPRHNHRLTHDTVHLVWLSRQTRHRRVLNEDQILASLANVASITVEKAEFTHAVPFERQARRVSAADILVGMHGAGLTHMLFLPHWAAVYELYHCGDPHCYRHLADMRGLKYVTTARPADTVTPQNQGEHPQLGAHEKFTNYTLDVSEVVRLVQQAVRHVRTHSAFIAARHSHQQQQQEHDEL